MSGKKLKQLAEAAGLGPIDVCQEASISIPTLYKVYNDDHVRAKTRIAVEQAINRLAAKAQAQTA